MSNWAIVREEDNLCVNVCVWDGVTPWSPPAGHTVVLLGEQCCAGIGWRWNEADGTWTDERPQPEPQEPSEEVVE